MVAVLIFTAVVAAVLAGVVVVLHRRLRALDSDPVVDVVPRQARTSGTREIDAIVVEITNHAEVAASRTLLAKPLAAVSPGLIRSIVNKESLRIMRDQLAKQGVAADVRLRRLRIPIAVVEVDVEVEEPESDPLDEWLHNDGDNPYDE